MQFESIQQSLYPELRTGGSTGQENETIDMTILINVLLQAGEKYMVSASNFDQFGLDGFSAVTLEIFDPSLPAYQPDHCSNVEIFVDYDGKTAWGNCSADNFKAGEIVLINNSEIGLDVAATMHCNSNKSNNTSR